MMPALSLFAAVPAPIVMAVEGTLGEFVGNTPGGI
jgi:hypothetical protein